MAGEPIRKLATPDPRARDGSRGERSLARTDPAQGPHGTDGRARDTRRGPHRLRTDAGSAAQEVADRSAGEQDFYLPREAGGMTLFLVAAFVLAALVFQGLPSPVTLGLALASAALFACGSLFAVTERRPETGAAARLAIVFFGIILPMACAGLALALWVAEGLPWQWAIATLVCINAAAAALFDMRIVSLFIGKIAGWAGFAILAPSGVTYAAIIAAALTLLLIARLEWKAAQRRRLAREARERVAARAEDILRSFEETGQGWFWETDRRGLITYISPKAAAVLGRRAEDVVGGPLAQIVDPSQSAADAERTLAFHLSARSAFHDVEVRAATTGEERWWALAGRPVYDGYKNFCGFRGHGTDLTEKRRSEQQVSRLAHYDSLTGLANRVQMSKALEQILAAPSARERSCAVLMLDLDRFKQVNDTLGHPAGDALLKQVAQRLERAIGQQGRCGRLGGDEFQVIVPGHQDRSTLAQLAQEIIAALSQPYAVQGTNVVIGASVGIALAPEHGASSEELIRNVDLALYAAKDAGRGVSRFYAADLHAAVEERAELEQDLREAIAKGEFQLFYQPVVFAANEKIVGFEALMRWHHPKRGWISPSKFVPIAEDTGLIDRIGQWVLRTACEDLARWPRSVRCAVNVSALQFANPDLPNIVANALAHSGVAPSRLELEITESVFLNDNAGTDAMFKALKRVGVRLALDDFGTGYSSLGYLKKAPFDKIKIDRSFVQGATEEGSRNGAIIASITSLAEALHMDTTAEGVETLDELELVRLLGCSHVQGHIYFKPMSAAEAALLVAGDLVAEAEGPQSVRAKRQNLLRRVVVVHNGNRLNATVRNVSESGAMVEGLWNVPAGSVLRVEFGADTSITAQVRWSRENRVGIEFHQPLQRRADGGFPVFKPATQAAPIG
ncbi:EAL domain-containing protein [Erythrobacter neustonensis]|uniref:Diguanylate cyclase n=1 Tax=Erythrobacter neustonensis TaxID=1112 RepID=A0A192D6S5_9SPHN|nr:EAL domain-containing protein [Erythrobacter neustonensis]ANK13731.1 diguanylate cyclase [Erythrobacter neustonensis]